MLIKLNFLLPSNLKIMLCIYFKIVIMSDYVGVVSGVALRKAKQFLYILKSIASLLRS